MTRADAAPAVTRRLRPATRAWLSTAFLNNVGDGISQIGFQVLLGSSGHGPVALALSYGANQVGLLSFSLLGGRIVDRADRGRLLVSANALRGGIFAATALAVSVSDESPLALVVAAQLVLGALEVVADGAAEALLVTVADDRELDRATGRLGALETAGNSFVGPPIGGAVAGVSVAWCFGLDALSYAVAAVIFAVVLRNVARDRVTSAEVDAGAQDDVVLHAGDGLWDGARFLFREPRLRLAVIVASTMAVAYTAVLSQAFLVAEALAGIEGRWFGIVFSLEAIGFICAGVAFERFNGQPRAFLSAAVGLAGGSLLVLSLVGTWAVLAVALLLNGIGNGLIVSHGMVTRMRVVPDPIRGRVQAAYRGCMIVGSLVGVGAGGVLMTTAGASVTTGAAGVFLLLVGWLAVGANRRSEAR